MHCFSGGFAPVAAGGPKRGFVVPITRLIQYMAMFLKISPCAMSSREFFPRSRLPSIQSRYCCKVPTGTAETQPQLVVENRGKVPK